jgi:hypothetical protein
MIEENEIHIENVLLSESDISIPGVKRVQSRESSD